MHLTRTFLTRSLCFTLVLAPACDDAPEVPATEQGEHDIDVDPEAPEDDPSAPNLPPANWTTLSTDDPPTLLTVYANGSEKNAGTAAPLKLTYRNGAGTYSCTLSGGVASGKAASCTPTLTSTKTAKDIDVFFLEFATGSDTDGLRFSFIGATINGTRREIGDFNVNAVYGNGAELDCTGCIWDVVPDKLVGCGSCYLDSNDHTGCVEAIIIMTKAGTNAMCDLG